jgi:Cu(I)/Ag(I) efflux system membrane protein CusA/SilA
MMIGLVPLLWATGSGADVMKRIAAPMVGGLVTSAFLTLELIPVIYTYWRYSQLKKADAHRQAAGRGVRVRAGGLARRGSARYCWNRITPLQSLGVPMLHW